MDTDRNRLGLKMCTNNLKKVAEHLVCLTSVLCMIEDVDKMISASFQGTLDDFKMYY